MGAMHDSCTRQTPSPESAFGSGLAAKRTGIRSLSVMAIRRGFVIVTCHCPYRAYVVCPRVGQSGLRQAFDDLDELVAAVAVPTG